jgi:hypothetical protein
MDIIQFNEIEKRIIAMRAVPTKLHNTLNGLRKKYKLEVAALQLEEMQSWVEK